MDLKPRCNNDEGHYGGNHYTSCFFSERRTNEGYLEYYRREKMPSGMTAEFVYELYMYGRSKKEYKLIVMPSFVIYKKRNQAWQTPGEITGKDALKPLMFAKECLTTLEKFMTKDWTYQKYQDILFSISWVDGKRGRLYRKLLERDGYNFVHEENQDLLNRHIRENGVNMGENNIKTKDQIFNCQRCN